MREEQGVPRGELDLASMGSNIPQCDCQSAYQHNDCALESYNPFPSLLSDIPSRQDMGVPSLTTYICKSAINCQICVATYFNQLIRHPYTQQFKDPNVSIDGSLPMSMTGVPVLRLDEDWRPDGYRHASNVRKHKTRFASPFMASLRDIPIARGV
jgi:hypothetical protein